METSTETIIGTGTETCIGKGGDTDRRTGTEDHIDRGSGMT